MELTNLIDHYGELKTKANKLYAEYKTLMEQVEATRRELHAALDTTGLKSAKSAAYGVTIATKTDIIVSNEHLAMEWLKDAPNVESDFYIGIKTTAFKQMALAMLKETGEIAPGTEITQKESVNLTPNKKAANNGQKNIPPTN